jgi:hypothetical protein
LSLATAWLHLEDISLSEIRQTEKDKYHAYVEAKKMDFVEVGSRIVTRGWGGHGEWTGRG